MRRFIFQILRRNWVAFLAASLASGAAAAAMAGLISLVNSLVATRNSSLMWAFIGVAVFTTVMAFTSEFITVWLAEAIIYRIRITMCRQVLDLPLSDIEQLGSSRLLAGFADDTMFLAHAISMIGGLCVQAVTVLSLIVYIAVLSRKLLVITLVAFAAATSMVIVIRALSAPHYQTSRRTVDRAFAGVRLLTDGIKELKLHRQRREGYIAEELVPAFRKLMVETIKGDAINALAAPAARTVLYATIVIVLIYGQSTGIPDADVAAYPLSLIAMVSPIDQFLATVPIMTRGQIAIESLESLGVGLHDVPAETADDPAAADGWDELVLDGVTHSYPAVGGEAPFLLGPVSLTLKRGQITFIVGGNGSGKTTLAKLLTGLYAVDEGQIRLGGRVVGKETLAGYRNQFSTVFADFSLFPPLKAVERSPSAKQKARGYLRALKLTNDMTLAGVGPTSALSQGQRRRLALFSALLDDRPIYVFDEWAADQDPHFKNLFYTKFLPSLKAAGKTVVVISHDDRYFGAADQLVKMDNGIAITDEAWEALHGRAGTRPASIMPDAAPESGFGDG